MCVSSSTGKGLEQRGVYNVGGVDGRDGNRVGRMGGGDGGSCMVGDEGGKNTTALMGETAEGEACCAAGLLRESGGIELWSGLDGNDVQEWDVALVTAAGGAGGMGVSSDTQGAGEGVVVLGCDVSAEGEPTGRGGRTSVCSQGEAQEKAVLEAAVGEGDATAEVLWTLVCLVGGFSCQAAGTGGTDGTS